MCIRDRICALNYIRGRPGLQQREAAGRWRRKRENGHRPRPEARQNPQPHDADPGTAGARRSAVSPVPGSASRALRISTRAALTGQQLRVNSRLRLY
eukprot:9730961-Alexandrium_andersonii.AAC.1